MAEICKYDTHPRAQNREPYEKSIAGLTFACRYDGAGTFESILDGDVAVFCLEEPQKDLLCELMYVIVETDKHLLVQLTNTLLYGAPIPPYEVDDPKVATEYHMERVPDDISMILNLLKYRSSDSYGIVVQEPYL